jgi:hypothetical protein
MSTTTIVFCFFCALVAALLFLGLVALCIYSAFLLGSALGRLLFAILDAIF